VRIIGGQWRRRVLRFPDSPALRPTPDRVRETLFNWLGQDLDGLSCLDLFAGSGALGFEAASRGAARVVMVDQSSAVPGGARGQRETPGSRRARADRALGCDKICGFRRLRYDLLFLDPPFHHGWIDRLAPLLAGVLAADGIIYAEAEHFPGGLRQLAHGAPRPCRPGFYHLMRGAKRMALNKRVAIYAGTFDPMTRGHEDLVRRAACLFDRVIVAIAQNQPKRPFFSLAERVEMAQAVLAPVPECRSLRFRRPADGFSARQGCQSDYPGSARGFGFRLRVPARRDEPKPLSRKWKPCS
jgi:16S rRNA (guanine966-N2)-methyltransferase